MSASHKRPGRRLGAPVCRYVVVRRAEHLHIRRRPHDQESSVVLQPQAENTRDLEMLVTLELLVRNFADLEARRRERV